jgi:septal ring factor EnvC (AmiA/AmiB activator)
MARRTDGEKVDALELAAAKLDVNLSNARAEIDKIYQRLQDAERELNSHLKTYEREIAQLKHQVEELKKSNERTGQRLWMILAPLVSAVLASVTTYLLGIKK